ncbi:PhnD/SsuA/transferrin family substrate-binding protein [uncultured Desulfobulbus sp.]|uniref:PhnD/SsuA/transferrin family substrate-binding protein n=1 Tax=uncultured Desulfobulbus sp. TaxID=239745 RepID=UPI0029C882DC|nr:PhnD/SsuA/transferrin family substrate-binding protein [uncultured Desulfobulbus sp.]
MTTNALLLHRLLVTLCAFLLFTPTLQATVNDPATIHIGILAIDGKEQCFDRWRATGEYLQKALPQFGVSVVCLEHNEIEKAVFEGRVDFTVTNPAVYVNLEYIFGASRIATLKDLGDPTSVSQYGGVIFSKSGRNDIKTVADLKGKRVAASDQASFGGWQIAWLLLKQSGIDPFKDFAALEFLGQRQSVVTAVLQGKFDAGVVRTGTLEEMVDDGRIAAAAYSIIGQKETEDTFPYARTTELYPHWALAKVYHVNNDLAARVMFAFLQIDPSSPAARAARIQGWTIPLDYYPVHQCLQELKTGPYRHLLHTPPVTIGQLYHQYRYWVYGGTGLFVLILGAMMHVFLLNRRLSAITLKLRHEHQEREKTLADLNEFKITLDQVQDSVFMYDPDTLLFFYVNQGGLDQIGYTLAEMKQLTPLAIKPDLTEPQFKEMLSPLHASNKDTLTFTTRHRRKDGSFLPVEVFLQHITPEGKKSRFVAIVRDITRRMEERKEREQLLTRLNSEQKMASIGQLAAGIAHEINTPAQYLGSNIDFLDEAFTGIDALIKKYDQLLSLPEVSASPELLANTINELKNQTDWDYFAEEIPRAIEQTKEGISKISSIVLAMKEFSHPGCKEKQATDLNKLIDTTITVASNEWKYVADIYRKLDRTLPLFSCLPNEMGQVMLNLLVNAVHAIKDKTGAGLDGVKGKITIESRRVDDSIEITLTDTGGGIPEAIGTKIFDPFFTTKEVGRGTGQGLTICHDIIVNKHGGTIEFVSTEGEGTTFIIRLPLSESPNA